MFLRTVMCGQSAYDWKTIPMSRLLGGTLIRRAASKTVRSPKAIWPSSADSRPATQRSVVVLPHPLGPSKTRNSPSSISSSRSSIAVVGVLPPNRFERPRMLTLDTWHHHRSRSATDLGRGASNRAQLLAPRWGELLEQGVPARLEVRDLLRGQVREPLVPRAHVERLGNTADHGSGQVL